jgi:hypothetical protein
MKSDRYLSRALGFWTLSVVFFAASVGIAGFSLYIQQREGFLSDSLSIRNYALLAATMALIPALPAGLVWLCLFLLHKESSKAFWFVYAATWTFLGTITLIGSGLRP